MRLDAQRRLLGKAAILHLAPGGGLCIVCGMIVPPSLADLSVVRLNYSVVESRRTYDANCFPDEVRCEDLL